MQSKPLVIALSKGRILDDTLSLLDEAGIRPIEDIRKSRKLLFDSNQKNVKLIISRPSDVPKYIELGAADIGITGKDVLMEHNSPDLLEQLDLKIANCNLMTAAIKNSKEPKRQIKVASKFVGITKRYFEEKGYQADVIKLYGGLELAPIMGLADMIVDIVDTGNTLKANGLEPRELIAPISSRLVTGKTAIKTKQHLIKPIIDQLSAAVARRQYQSK